MLVSCLDFLNNSSLALDLPTGHEGYLALTLTLKSREIFLKRKYDKSFEELFFTTVDDLLPMKQFHGSQTSQKRLEDVQETFVMNTIQQLFNYNLSGSKKIETCELGEIKAWPD